MLLMFCQIFIIAVMTANEVSSLNVDLAHWMKDLPQPLKDLPLIYLAIPGSHDSMTYSIKRSSTLAPDAEPVLHKLYPLFRGSILRWTITQKLDALQQLQIGIRYFDLRLATKAGSSKFFFTHGVYADEISIALEQVKEFVDSSPGEVVILDFQHFYGFSIDDHQHLMRYLINLYNRRLVPRPVDLRSVTLSSVLQQWQQIIIIYRHESVYGTPELWQPQMLPSPWPRQDKSSQLMMFLNHVKRHPGLGFVHQAVLTPTPAFILLRWISNLRERCAIPVMKDILPKLANFTAGPPREDVNPAPVNVVIADFVELNNLQFPRTIVGLNYKLLNNLGEG